MEKIELKKGIKLHSIFMAICFVTIVIGELAESLKNSLTQSVGLSAGILLVVAGIIISVKNLLTSKKHLSMCK